MLILFIIFDKLLISIGYFTLPLNNHLVFISLVLDSFETLFIIDFSVLILYHLYNALHNIVGLTIITLLMSSLSDKEYITLQNVYTITVLI